MIRKLIPLFLLVPAVLAAQSDTTVHIDVRVRVPTQTVRDTVVRVDTVKVPAWTQYFYWTPFLQGDSIHWQFSSNNNDATMPKTILAPHVSGGVIVRVDTVTIVRVRVDTVRIASPAVSGVPELPRTTVDVTMPLVLLTGDTLYACTTTVCKCKGPTAARTCAERGFPYP